LEDEGRFEGCVEDEGRFEGCVESLKDRSCFRNYLFQMIVDIHTSDDIVAETSLDD
jgi:hypothetical protein